MSDIDRLFQHLVRTIQTTFPAHLHQPFEVAELYQNILPYRHHRRELGFETNQDYEMALLELLSGAGSYLVVEDRMRDVLQRELASRNPDPGTFREFAQSHVALAPDAVARVLGTTAAGTPTAPLTAPVTAPPIAPSATTTGERRTASPKPQPAPAPAPAPASPTGPRSATARPSLTPSPPRLSTPVASARPSQTGMTPTAGETCRYCGGTLPAGRRITFCPHCGQNLTVTNCPACGTELEMGWKFCPTCGRPASST